jgi:xyloglucan-specific exo-beta-1,4-glucanase
MEEQTMKVHCKRYYAGLALPALLATLLAGCGGSPESGLPAVSTAATSQVQGAGLAAASWTSVKWAGGGYVTGLVYHPVNASLLYARTDVGGVYRWNAADSSWIPLTDGIGFGGGDSRFHCVESLALDPSNDQRIYIATGDTTRQGANGRLYISRDRGNSWTWVNLPFMVGGNDTGRAMGERLKVDPTNPSILFYGTRTAGLWQSRDAGQTWAQVTGLSSTTISGSTPPIGVEHLMFDNSKVGGGETTWIMYAAIAPDYANAAGLNSVLYKSVNGGFSWTPVPVPAAVAGYHIPHVVRAADGNYYMVFNKNAGEGPGGPGYLYKFGGVVFNENWTLLSSSTTGGYSGISVHGTGSNARIALGVTATWGDNPGQVTQLSDNGGSTWREIEANMPHLGSTGNGYSGWNDTTVIDPANRDHIMHVHGGGIWETTNASSATPSWSAKDNNLEETATLALVTPPAGASYKFINSAGDIGTWVNTDLATRPTKGPMTWWSNGNSADMAWSDPQYIAATGVDNANNHVGVGHWSGDGGNTWARFAALPAGATSGTDSSANLAVTTRNNVVWAPNDAVPSYTTNNGASWTATNLPAKPAVGVPRSYLLKADRKNPNKVYAYDSGGAWWNQWSDTAHFWYSSDGGKTFTERAAFKAASPMLTSFNNTSMAVNPNVEGDIWLADGNTVYHSVDAGASWTKLSAFSSIWGSNQWPDVQGATVVTLGKAAPGAPYSAAVYVVGVINGVWGVYRSDDAGATWSRFNDDAHQYAGIFHMAGDWNTYGRVYASGNGRGVLYTN